MKTKDIYICNTSPVNPVSLKLIPHCLIDSMPPFPPQHWHTPPPQPPHHSISFSPRHWGMWVTLVLWCSVRRFSVQVKWTKSGTTSCSSRSCVASRSISDRETSRLDSTDTCAEWSLSLASAGLRGVKSAAPVSPSSSSFMLTSTRWKINPKSETVRTWQPQIFFTHASLTEIFTIPQ